MSRREWVVLWVLSGVSVASLSLLMVGASLPLVGGLAVALSPVIAVWWIHVPWLRAWEGEESDR